MTESLCNWDSVMAAVICGGSVLVCITWAIFKVHNTELFISFQQLLPRAREKWTQIDFKLIKVGVNLSFSHAV